MSLMRAKLVRVAVSHKIAICFVLLLAGAGLLGLSMRRTLPVHGSFSQQEVSEIVRAVRLDMWGEAFPDSSWRTVKRAPPALWAVATARISEVTQIDGNLARVRGRFRLKTISAGYVLTGWDSWTLKKERTKWTVQRRSRTPQGLPRQAATWDGGVNFSEEITNKSRLSYDARP
jgi:hypothetical protein